MWAYNDGNHGGKGRCSMENKYTDEWADLTLEEKKRKLYERQKATLQGFLERNAISKEQYEKSLGDLTVKMGYSGIE
jgi:hypothetical protein